MTLPEINPALYVYIFVQTFLFVPVVATLAVVRLASARGRARQLAGLAALVALVALGLQFGPAFLGLYEGWLPVFAGQATRALDGLALPLAPSLLLLASARAPGRRFWGIDAVHLVALAGFLGLYGYVNIL
jgi:hypothetical protein